MDNGNGTQTVSAGEEIVYGTDDNHSVMSEKVSNFLCSHTSSLLFHFVNNLYLRTITQLSSCIVIRRKYFSDAIVFIFQAEPKLFNFIEKKSIIPWFLRTRNEEKALCVFGRLPGNECHCTCEIFKTFWDYWFTLKIRFNLKYLSGQEADEEVNQFSRSM